MSEIITFLIRWPNSLCHYNALFEKGVVLAVSESRVSQKTLAMIPSSAVMFDKGQAIENIKAVDFDKTINQLDSTDLDKIQSKFEKLKLEQLDLEKNITKLGNGTR